MLRLVKKTLYFIVPFSAVFWLIHWKLEAVISRTTLNGLSGFYSADGIIFGLIVAFVIQREWEIWTKLLEAVMNERDAARELWKWCALSEDPSRARALGHIESYLALIVSEWQVSVRERSRKIDAELDALRALMAPMALSMPSTGFHLVNTFARLAAARDSRLNFSNERMPIVLKRIVVFADILLIVLSLFIAVNNVYMDYLFTAAISIMAFTLILVINDLDDPFRQGTWHITTEAYEKLLKELRAGIGNN